MRIVAFLMAVSAGHAGAVEVTACAQQRNGFTPMVQCEVKNSGDTAIASLKYGMKITQPGRSVPWGDIGLPGSFLGGAFARIRGGIEPGETVPVLFRAPDIPERADPEKIVIEIEIYEARDVNDAVIAD